MIYIACEIILEINQNCYLNDWYNVHTLLGLQQEIFNDRKGVIRSRKQKNRQYNRQKKKEQTMIYKTLDTEN